MGLKTTELAMKVKQFMVDYVMQNVAAVQERIVKLVKGRVARQRKLS